MKKFYSTLVIVAVLLMALPSQAQVKFGIRGGANLVNMSLSDGIRNLSGDNRAGFYIGPTVKVNVPLVGLSLDGSLLYDQRSTKVTDETNTRQNITSHSLAVPVNVRYGWGVGTLADVFIFAGPQVAFNFSNNKYFGVTDWKWKDSNFSVNVGVGCTILSHLELKANYNIACGSTGEANLIDAATKTVIGSTKSKINSWQLGLAYYF